MLAPTVDEFRPQQRQLGVVAGKVKNPAALTAVAANNFERPHVRVITCKTSLSMSLSWNGSGHLILPSPDRLKMLPSYHSDLC